MTSIALANIRPATPSTKRVPCSTDPEAWYDSAKDAATKRICGTCPVRTMCLEVALNLDEPWGVWGGYSADERLRLAAGHTAKPCRGCGVDFVPPVATTTTCDACAAGTPPWPIDEDVPTIRQLAATGFSDAMIAERLHRNPNTVRSCRLRHGIACGRFRNAKPKHVKQALAGCGTAAAYRRHLRKKEPVDEACRRANAVDVANKRARQTQPNHPVTRQEVSV